MTSPEPPQGEKGILALRVMIWLLDYVITTETTGWGNGQQITRRGRRLQFGHDTQGRAGGGAMLAINLLEVARRGL